MTSRYAAAMAGIGFLGACIGLAVPSAQASHEVPGFTAHSPALVAAMTTPRVVAHMNELQWIADRNDSHRAAGSSGYAASLNYVRRKLEEAGYRTVTQTFTFPFFEERRPPVFQLTAPVRRNFVPGKDVATVQFSGAGRLSGRLVPVDLQIPPGKGGSTSGCESADFPSPGPAPAVALIQRGTCSFSDKVSNARAAGYEAVVIFNDGRPGSTDLLMGSLDAPSPLPVLGTTYSLGRELASLAEKGAVVRLDVTTRSEERKTANLLAETSSGDPGRVVMVGAHLDSVEEGPGINDNASGSAAILELAIQMARQDIRPRNRVRFAWWGAEEAGLYGSKHHVATLTPGQAKAIMVYLNFDMIASHNFVWHIQEGDPKSRADALVEQVLASYFKRARLPHATIEAFGNSDYAPFMEIGIPIGGLFSGASDMKTPREAASYGGTAGQAQDACYHKACDTNRFINRRSVRVLSKAIADTTYRFAMTARDLRSAGMSGSGTSVRD
ncbi:MAG TPA: M20/M25/M40 family metallo-hydrolase [Geminicoccus sp.]|jgi:Zn-dependent M28 family amino/carboxypeptidase|uniref:M20/M25/M40 family metallo-hydrolase n=1 Tax=Geminicoccus sp. TaxID=2024832 RepID=UPI002E321653|nr:M20/M25/M40 family metallo-hydrolase [Geminicoccus sp.]HEX2526301.1 M20/M25/M40 family metallo-hydrolase [Geminicoccus sp.]